MNRKIEALQEAAAQKAQEAADRVDKALAQMVKQGQTITFANVAHAADVSTAYLYKHEDIKNRIQTLRDQQKSRSKPKKPPTASDNSKSVIIYNLREETKKLKAEIQGLRKVNESIAGRLYQLQESSNLAERLRAENSALAEENRLLRVELESTRAELEECKKQIVSSHPKVTPIDSRQKPVQTEGISDELKSEISELGIRLNDALIKQITSTTEEQIKNALLVVKEQMAIGKVRSKGGLFRKALEEGWHPNEPESEIEKSSFDEWYDLARTYGVVHGHREEDGVVQVKDVTGQWVDYKDFSAKWTLDYLRRTVKGMR